jgi:tetratricopeptide (TPR) repeat protein
MSWRTPPTFAATKTRSRRADRPRRTAPSAALLLALPLLFAAACRSEEDEEKLTIHKIEAQHFYDFGDYVRAEDQCRRGLKIAKGDPQLGQMLGYCLLNQAGPKQLDEAAQIFADEIGIFGNSDWRFDLGLGMTDQMRAHALVDSKSPKDVARAEELRESARSHLDVAYEATRKVSDVPRELPYHLALLDFDERRFDLFRQHAEEAVKLMLVTDKILAVQISKIEDDNARKRTETDRTINAERARRLLRELARLAWNQTPPDVKTAAAHMTSIEKFGTLTRPDYYIRGRIREMTGELEGAVADYEKFLSLSADVADENVTKAVESLTKLRAHLAEKRVGGTASGQ